MMKIDSDRLQALLAEHSVTQQWWRLRSQAGELLDHVRVLATDADPRIRRQTWDALDLLVDDSNRDAFYRLLIDGLAAAQFRTLLTDTDPVVRTRVCWVRTRTAPDKKHLVTMALELLADERFDYAWPECIEVLRRPIHFDILVGALADAPSEGLGDRLLVTLGLPAATRLPEIPLEQPASPIDCSQRLSNRCDDVVATRRCKHLPVVVALLGSSFESVRNEAMWALNRSGPGTADLLRSVRRSDPSVRRAALVMLAEFGWDQIPAEDLVILRRLIQLKQRDQAPEPLHLSGLNGAWYALPTTDQAAVLDALDLTDPVPATMRMGFAPWQGARPQAMPTDRWANQKGDFWTENAQRYKSDPNPEVFVTPALDGWTLVFCCNETLGGMTPGSTSVPSRYEMYRRIEQLSQRFGTAHWYEQFVDDFVPTTWSQWCIARDGEIHLHCVSSDDVRVYRCQEDNPIDSLDELNAWIEANDHRREPRPAREEQARAKAYAAMLEERGGDDRLPIEDEEPEYPLMADSAQDLVFGAGAVAQRLSIDLESLGPHTPVQHTGVLATPRSLRHRLRRGALPI
ncbi:hypothetical protein ACLMAL_19390 [Nocardia sp. CWNU-33]|uniref:hypothetical protein n=1 Tax=Nocardia sp. CWNU-33 TaxID=3392117 RepID=UPI00398F5F2C